MTKDLLLWDETLFRNPEIFEIDYIPEQFNYREDQMKEIAFHLKPALRGGRPLNTLCRGLPGTGKTTSIRKIYSDIEETTKKIVPVYINCQIENTKFAIFSRIFRRLSGHTLPTSGTSFKVLFDAVAKILTEGELVLSVALDDANYLLYEDELNKVLYTLLRSHEAWEGTRIGVIIVLSDLDIDISRAIDARVASVYLPTEVYFAPYNEAEVREILHERVIQGLYPGVLSQDMFDLVIDHTMVSGDLRVGIDILKRATLNAEREAKKKIEEEHILKAYAVSKYLHLTASVKTLRADEKEVLMSVAEQSREGLEMNAGDVFTHLKETKSIGYTRYYEIIRKFDQMRLVNLTYRGGKGRTRLISLRYDPQKVIEYLN